MSVIYEIARFLDQRFAEERYRLDYLQRYGFPVEPRFATAGTLTSQVLMQAYADLMNKQYLVKEALRYSPELEHGDNGEYVFEMMLKVFALSYVGHSDYKREWQDPVTTSPFSAEVQKMLQEPLTYSKAFLADVDFRTPPGSATR